MEIILVAFITVAALLGGVASVRLLMKVDELTQQFVKPVAQGFMSPQFKGDRVDYHLW